MHEAQTRRHGPDAGADRALELLEALLAELAADRSQPQLADDRERHGEGMAGDERREFLATTSAPTHCRDRVGVDGQWPRRDVLWSHLVERGKRGHHRATIERVLAIPPKRFQRALVTFLTEPEIDALLAASDRSTWTGRRDHAMLLLATQTGLRVSELIGLTCGDVHLGVGAHLSCLGKGRKQRITPLTKQTVAVLRTWLAERAGQRDQPLFPTRTGRALSRDAIERRIAKHAATATAACPTLQIKKVTAHALRHTAAMRLLHAGVDTSVIALWLGHEQIETTQIYLHADMTLKEQALSRTTPHNIPPGRYLPPDTLLAFLEAL